VGCGNVNNFTVYESPVTGAGTHAIVIGVGRYSHLLGGAGALTRSHEHMGQLTSPPLSARKFATWLINDLNLPYKPLASVALLLAENSAKPFQVGRKGPKVAVAEATIANVEAALHEWRARGERSDDERLIFYFCGHGMGRGTDTTLITSDYGANQYNALDGAIDFRALLTAMDQCAAREQLYFIDACRVASATLLSTGGYNGRPIFQPDIWTAARQRLRRAPVYYATIAGAAAYAQANQPSIFTAALLAGLSGCGSDDIDDGKWQVTTSRLKEVVDFLMGREEDRLGRVSVPAADDQGRIVLHVPKRKPKGIALVQCQPDAANAVAELVCLNGGRVKKQRETMGAQEWLLELPVGSYEFVAEFPGEEFQRQTRTADIRPTVKRVTLQVSP
jgi:hypothetical protein